VEIYSFTTFKIVEIEGSFAFEARFEAEFKYGRYFSLIESL
jgi:hypothetical protein